MHKLNNPGQRGIGAGAILGLLALAAVVALVLAYRQTQGAVGQPTAHAYVPPPPIVIRPSEYRAIPLGALYRDVAKHIGSPGTRMSETAVAGHRSMVVGWVNPDGSNAQMIFSGTVYEKDDELALMSKAQAGLE